MGSLPYQYVKHAPTQNNVTYINNILFDKFFIYLVAEIDGFFLHASRPYARLLEKLML